MVRPLRPEPDAGAIVQPEPAPLLLFWWDLQPFALPDTLDPLVVHVPARLVQQRRHRPVAVPAILRRQFDDVRRQTIFIRAASRNLALCRAVLAERAAGAALRYAKRLPHAVDALPATRRAQKFPRVSQNARRHGLSLPPGDETVRGWLSIILEDPALEGHVLTFEGQSRAASLADAEARLQRVRETEFRFLEDCRALNRGDAHLVNPHEVVTTSARIFDSYKIDADGVRRPLKVKSKPVVIKREEKIQLTKYPDKLRRLLRYRREAECRRRRALKAWVAYLKRTQKSKTKPKEAAHAA
jgi:hypothetical protein